jgi:hypothetical protein
MELATQWQREWWYSMHCVIDQSAHLPFEVESSKCPWHWQCLWLCPKWCDQRPSVTSTTGVRADGEQIWRRVWPVSLRTLCHAICWNMLMFSAKVRASDGLKELVRKTSQHCNTFTSSRSVSGKSGTQQRSAVLVTSLRQHFYCHHTCTVRYTSRDR